MHGTQPPTAGFHHRPGHANLADANQATIMLEAMGILKMRISNHERNWAPTLWAVTLLAAVTSAWGMLEILDSSFQSWMIAVGIALGITLIFPALWTAISQSVENLGPLSSVIAFVLAALTLSAQLAISTLTTAFLILAQPIGAVDADRLAIQMGVHLQDSGQVLKDFQTGLERLEQRHAYFDAMAIKEENTGTTLAGEGCAARCISLQLAGQLFEAPINTFESKIQTYTELKADADVLLVALDALDSADSDFINQSQDLQRQIADKINMIDALDVRGAYSAAADQIAESVPVPIGVSRSAQLFIENIQNQLQSFAAEIRDAGDATMPLLVPQIQRHSEIMNVIHSLHEWPHIVAISMLLDVFGVLMLVAKVISVMRLSELRSQYQDLMALEHIRGDWSEQGGAFAPNLTAQQLIQSAQTLALLQRSENGTPVPPQPKSSHGNGELH